MRSDSSKSQVAAEGHRGRLHKAPNRCPGSVSSPDLFIPEPLQVAQDLRHNFRSMEATAARTESNLAAITERLQGPPEDWPVCPSPDQALRRIPSAHK